METKPTHEQPAAPAPRRAIHHSLEKHKARIIELYNQGHGVRPIARDIGNGHGFASIHKALRRWGITKAGHRRPQWNKGLKKAPTPQQVAAREWEEIEFTIMSLYRQDIRAVRRADKAWEAPWVAHRAKITSLAAYHKTKHLPESKAKWRERYLKRKEKEGFRDQQNATRERWKSKPGIRLRANLGVRLALAVRATANGKKCASITKLFGCTQQELKEHIERQFTKGMTWENYGRVWHCDHIVPISYFDMTKPEEQARSSHFTNLRPLPAIENMRRGNRVGAVQSTLCL